MLKDIHYSQELEAAVLGACLLEKTAFGRTYGLINEETFYLNDNKTVYSFMRKMYNDSLPIDLITVHLHMTAAQVELIQGNIPWYLSVLTNHIVSTANLEYHCYILKNMWRKRELEKITQSGTDNSTDTREQIKLLNDQLLNIQGNEFKKEWYTMDELMFDLMQHQQEISEGKKEFITTGFKSIDNQNGGFTAGQLIVLGARPSVGKSALMAKMAISQAVKKKKVGIISLEMNNTDIAARLSSLETDIEFWRIHRNLFADEQQQQKFYRIINEMSGLSIFTSDKTKVDINEIKAKASKLKNYKGIDCLMVDYLQLVDSSYQKNTNREQEVARISRGLKLLAMEMQIPVIVLCQLNRQSVQRKGAARYPQLSDLRESGAIEQDADVVMMLHRDWLIEGFQADANGYSTEFKADLLVQKWRNGATCHLELEFEPEKMKFKERAGSIVPLKNFSEPQDEANPF